MLLYRLAYASQPSQALNTSDLQNILTKSVNNNARNNITGALLFNTEVFLQILEGPRASLNATYRCISKDDRHARLEIIGLEHVNSRLFTSWSMAFLADNSNTRAIFERFCGNRESFIDELRLKDVEEMMIQMIGK